MNGVMTPREVQIQGRKVPLKEIRQRLLHKQLKYMRLIPESTIATMTRPELAERLKMKSYGKSEEELRILLSQHRGQDLSACGMTTPPFSSMAS